MILALNPLLVTLLIISGGYATQFITEDTLPSDSLSSACIAGLVEDVACPVQVASFPIGAYFDEEALEEACTSECSNALRAWEKTAAAACGEDDVYQNDSMNTAPVSFLPTLLYYYYNRTCLQDAGRWCNVAAYEMSGELEVQMKRQNPVDPCDNCLVKQLQFQAGSPIDGGYSLQSIYSSLTSSCSKTRFPLPTSATPVPEPTVTNIPPPSASCAGRTYTIQPGDDCQSISQSQGVGTAWLLADNSLQAWCVDFPTEGELCIQNTCTPYVVQANDTCKSIALDKRVSPVQLTTWNPILGPSCRSIERSVGDVICLSPPGDEGYDAVTTTSIPATTTPEPSAAPVPTDIAQGTTENCAAYYLVQPGDYCNGIILKYSISLEDFLFLNSGLNANCTNLYAYESYCVQPVGAIDQYPGHPGYIPPSSSSSVVPYSNLPKATFTPPTVTEAPSNLPLAAGTRQDCVVYEDGPNLQIDISYTLHTSVCQSLASGWGITLEQLQNWNPSLDTRSESCAPESAYRYCMAAYLPAAGTSTSEPSGSSYPIRDGAVEDCTRYDTVVPPMTCESVLRRHGLTIAQFYAMNPVVGSDCSNLWPRYRYCVLTPQVTTSDPSASQTTTTSVTATTTAPSYLPPPGPTQAGIPDNCNSWHVVKSDESCWTVTQGHAITLAQFYQWNPAVKNDCADGFWLGNAYCVGVGS